MTRILVTGVSGFIGTNFYLEIQKRFPSCHIIGIDNFHSSNIKNLKYFKGDFIGDDLRGMDWVYQFKDTKFDYIFHFGANSSTTDYDSLSQVTNNVESFRNILSLAAIYETPVIWASSASVYGNKICDDDYKEDDELCPDSPYAISKMLCENLAAQCSKINPDWRIIGIRPFNVFGLFEDYKGKMASMVTQLIKQIKKGENPKIFKDGNHLRDFIYVDNLVDLFITAAEKGKSGIYNGGTGVATSFNDLIDVLKRKMYKQHLEIQYIDNPHTHYQEYTCADLTKVNNELNWTPPYSFEFALDQVISRME